MSDDTKEIFDTIPFPLNPDQLDAMRLEGQSVSPTDFEDYKRIVTEEHGKLIDRYGKYISHPYSNEDFTRHFLVLDSDGYKEFQNHWLDKGHQSTSYVDLNQSSGRAYVSVAGNFFILHDFWGQIPDEDKPRIISSYGGEDNAKTEVNNLLGKLVATEEIVHLYQSHNPLWFYESGAQWYTRDLLSDESDLLNQSLFVFEKTANFYQKLIDKYGENIHKMFFGSLDNKELEKSILGEFTGDVIKDLFPNLK
jgi:hypothetical protein